MKKRSLAILLTTVLSLSSFSVIAKADGTDVSLREQAGIVPGNILYSLDKLVEKVQLVFTFSDAGKAELLANLAQERLGESQILLDKGDTESEKETLEAADEAMDDAAEVAAKAAEETKDTDSESKITKVQKTLENLVKVDAQFQGVLDQIKTGTTDDIKEKIAEVLETVTDKNAARKLAVAEMVDARHALNTAREALNQAKVSGDKEAIAKAQEEYKTAQTTFQVAFNDKQAAVNKNGKGQKDFSKKNEKSETAATTATSTSTALDTVAKTAVDSTATQVTANTTENLTLQSSEDGNAKKSSELKNEKTTKKENNGVGNAYGKEKNADKANKDKK